MDRISKKKTTARVEEKPTRRAKKTTDEKPAQVREATSVVAPVGDKARAYGVIVRPLVTEKAAVMQAGNKYSFVVNRSATKAQVKSAVKALYGVDAVKVHVVLVQGKQVRYGRSAGRRSDFKKAIVTLPAGKSITIHEGV